MTCWHFKVTPVLFTSRKFSIFQKLCDVKIATSMYQLQKKLLLLLITPTVSINTKGNFKDHISVSNSNV
jgi:hypothetical protein